MERLFLNLVSQVAWAQRAHAVVLVFAFFLPSPVRRRVAQADQGKSDEYV
jgi:hypothetical protein